MNNGDPFKNGLQRIRRQFQFIVHQVMPRFTFLEPKRESFYSDMQKNRNFGSPISSESWEPNIWNNGSTLKKLQKQTILRKNI